MDAQADLIIRWPHMLKKMSCSGSSVLKYATENSSFRFVIDIYMYQLKQCHYSVQENAIKQRFRQPHSPFESLLIARVIFGPNGSLRHKYWDSGKLMDLSSG